MAGHKTDFSRILTTCIFELAVLGVQVFELLQVQRRAQPPANLHSILLRLLHLKEVKHFPITIQQKNMYLIAVRT